MNLAVVQSPRRVAPRVVAACHDLARRGVTYPVLRRMSRLPEPSLLRLAARVGRRLTPTEEAVYSVIRKAVRIGAPGATLSRHELALLTGRSDPSIKRALRGLEALELVDRVPIFVNAEWQAVAWTKAGPRPLGTYKRRQLRSVYLLGRLAARPGKTRRGRDRHRTSSVGTPGSNRAPYYSPPKGEEVGGGPAATPRHPSASQGSEKLVAPPRQEEVSPSGTVDQIPPSPGRPERPVAPSDSEAAEDGVGEAAALWREHNRTQEPATLFDPNPVRSTRELSRAIADAFESFDRNKGRNGGAP